MVYGGCGISQLGVVPQKRNSSTWGTNAGGSWVLDQCELHSKTLYQKVLRNHQYLDAVGLGNNTAHGVGLTWVRNAGFQEGEQTEEKELGGGKMGTQGKEPSTELAMASPETRPFAWPCGLTLGDQGTVCVKKER